MPSAVPSAAASAPLADAVPTTGHGQLALTLQEVLTAVVRLRAGRQPVTDPAVFRAQMTQLLARADHEARAAGYRMEDVQLAVFAVLSPVQPS